MLIGRHFSVSRVNHGSRNSREYERMDTGREAKSSCLTESNPNSQGTHHMKADVELGGMTMVEHCVRNNQ